MSKLETNYSKYIELEQQENELTTRKEQLLEKADIWDKVNALDEEIKKLHDIKKSVKEDITYAMSMYQSDVFENDKVRIKYTPPTQRKGIDSKKLQATFPDVYKEVLQYTPVKDRVTITLKANKGVE